MKKVLMLAALVAAAASFAIVGTAGADPGGGATVVRTDGTCSLNAGTIGDFSCTFQVVTTPSGEVNLWVKGQVDPGDEPAETMKVDNASTGQFCDNAAPNFKGVVTKSGKINLQCRA